MTPAALRAAQSHYESMLDSAEQAASERADTIRFARPVVAAIHAIRSCDFTEEVAAQIAAVLSGRIGSCGWGHTARAINAMEYLDDAHTTLIESN